MAGRLLAFPFAVCGALLVQSPLCSQTVKPKVASEAAEQKLIQELDRLRQEQAALSKAVKQAEDQRQQLIAELTKLRNDLLAAKTQRDQLQSRNEHLLQQLVALEKALARPAADGNVVGTLNPPRELVRGEVTRIDAKDKLVEVNVGSQQGLEKGHTLEVYRLQPRPEYLGILRILEVTPTRAVGRMSSSPASRQGVQVGDQVASRLQPQ